MQATAYGVNEILYAASGRSFRGHIVPAIWFTAKGPTPCMQHFFSPPNTHRLHSSLPHEKQLKSDAL